MNPPPRFQNRQDAGEHLAAALSVHRGGRAWVVALPRGGVPVAAVIATRLGLPLEILVVRKIGAPGNPELAAGALGPGDVMVVNDWAKRLYLDHLLDATIERERGELERRENLYRPARSFPAIGNRTVILVDDGVATGATMKAAIDVLRHLGAARCIVAVPVAAPGAAMWLAREADEFVALRQPENFSGVGACYDDFEQLTDAEVLAILAKFQPAPDAR